VSIKELQQRIRPICESRRLKRLDLYGSRARSNGGEGNDYDFIVELQDSPPARYSQDFFALLHALEDEIGEPVDLMTYNSLTKDSLRANVEKDRIVIYEQRDNWTK